MMNDNYRMYYICAARASRRQACDTSTFLGVSTQSISVLTSGN